MHGSDIANCLNSLNSDKQTERKQANANWLELLKNKEVLSFLHKNTEERKRKDLTWNIVLKTIIRYVELELDSIKNSKVLEDTKRKRKKDAGQLLSATIQTAEKRRPVLKVNVFYIHVMETLRIDEFAPYFYHEYTSLLVKVIFHQSSHMSEMTVAVWQDMINLYIKLLESGKSWCDKLLTMQVISQLVTHAYHLPHFKTKSLIQLFDYLAKDWGNQANSQAFEVYLRCLNTFCQISALDCRHQICSLGEKSIPLLLPLWDKCWPSAKDQLVLFFLLQIKVHCPKGFHTEYDGAYSMDSACWKTCIEGIYSTMVDTFNKLGKKVQRSKTSLHQRHEMIELSAAIIHQVVCYKRDEKEDSLLEKESVAKRFKAESFWVEFCDRFQLCNDIATIMAWLQILGTCFNNHPMDFTQQDVGSVLSSLSSLLGGIKSKINVLNVLFTTLMKIGNGFQRFQQTPETSALWKTIISTSMKYCIVQQCQQEVYEMLLVLIENGIACEAKDFYNLVLADRSLPKPITLGLLYAVLGKLSIPSHNKLSSIKQNSSAQRSSTTKEELVNWLIPSVDVVIEDLSRHEKYSSHFELPMMALCVVAICHKNPQDVFKSLPSKITKLCTNDVESTVTVMENTFLMTALNEDLLNTTNQTFIKSKIVTCSPLKELISHFKSKFTSFVEILLGEQLTEDDILHSLSYKSGINILKFIYFTKLYLTHVSVPNDQDCISELTKKLSELQNKIEKSLTTSLRNCNLISGVIMADNLSHYEAIIWSLSKCLLIEDESPGLDNCCRLCNIPKPFSSLLVKILKNQLNDSKCVSMNLSASAKELTDSMDVDEYMSNDSNTPAVLSEDLLHHLTHSVIKLISHGEECERLCSSTREDIKTILFTYFDNVEVDNMSYVTLCFKAITWLCQEKTEMTAFEVETIYETARKSLSTYRNNQTVCCQGLDTLSCTLPIFSSFDADDERMKQSRNIINKLLSAFWTLKHSKYSPNTRIHLLKFIGKLGIYNCNSWLQIDSLKKGDDEPPVSALIARLLYDSNHQVRLCAIDILKQHLSHDTSYKSITYRLVSNAVLKVVHLPGELNEQEAEDESYNRGTCLLLTMSTVIQMSEECEKAALFHLIVDSFKQYVDLLNFLKVLKQLANYLSYDNEIEYFRKHCLYVLWNWIYKDHKLKEFPSELLRMTINDFFSVFRAEAVTCLILKGNKQELEDFNTDFAHKNHWHDLVKECFPSVAISTLSWAALKNITNTSEPTIMASKFGAAAYELLCDAVGTDVASQFLEPNLSHILVGMLLRKSPSNILMYPSLAQDYDDVTEFLSFGSKSGGNALMKKLSKSKDGFQRILFDLCQAVSRAKRPLERKQCLEAYKYFISKLMECPSKNANGGFPFVIHEVFHRCCHFLSEDRMHTNKDALLLLEILQIVVSTSLLENPEEIISHIPIIVHTLLPYVKQNGHYIEKQAISLLNVILVNEFSRLSPGIASLDAFPDVKKFAVFNQNIAQCKEYEGRSDVLSELERFLGDEGSQLFTIERLKDLERMLLKLKPILIDFIDESQEWRQRIASLLLLLCQQSQNEDIDVRVLCARCLGIFGPINLQLLSLPSPENKVITESCQLSDGNKEIEHQYIIVSMLSELLVNKRLDVVAVVTSTLRELLQSPDGIHFLKNANSDLAPYLEPFKCGGQKKMNAPKPPAPSAQRFSAWVSKPCLWQLECVQSECWAPELCCALIGCGAVEDVFLSCLSPVCKLQNEFSKVLLPYIVHNVLKSGKESYRQCLSTNINKFITQFISKDTVTNDFIDVAKLLLSIVSHLRNCDKGRKARGSVLSNQWDNNFWLDFNYLNVAKMAAKCSAHFPVFLYMEIWNDACKINDDAKMHMKDLDSSHRKLLLDAYRHIDEPDGIYGIGNSYAADNSTRIQRYEHEGHFEKALFLRNLSDTSTLSDYIGIAEGLNHSNLHHITAAYLRGAISLGDSTDNKKFLELQYESAWRNCEWRLDQEESIDCYSSNVFKSFVCLKDNDAIAFDGHVNRARLCVLEEWTHVNVNDLTKLYKTLSSLFALNELEKCKNIYTGLEDLTLAEETPLIGMDFNNVEPALSMKSVAYRISIDRVSPSLFGESDKQRLRAALDHSKRFCALAREAQAYKICEKEMRSVREISKRLKLPSLWRVDEAQMYWCEGESTAALQLLEELKDEASKGILNTDQSGYAHWLSLYGNWLVESKAENPVVIIEEYLEKAVQMMEKSQNPEKHYDDLIESYHCLAKYADCQYQSIADYMKSTVFENKRQLSDNVKAQIESILKLDPVAKEKTFNTKYYKTLARTLEQDRDEIYQQTRDRQSYLIKAMVSYFECLKLGEKYNLSVFRLCSLWFANFDTDCVNENVKHSASSIGSFKFIPLLYQLAARIGSSSTKTNNFFKETLESIIIRSSIEHPHHGIPILIALCNADSDMKISASKQNGSKRGKRKETLPQDRTSVDEERVAAAKSVLMKIRKSRSVIVNELETLSNAYIKLAYYNVDQYKKFSGPFDVPKDWPIQNCHDLKSVAVPTMEIPIDHECKYNNIVYVSKFDPKFNLCGGVNLPKILTCIGSDGIKRRQLVKGKDDLRQDAVMEQIFTIVNKLLMKDPETRKRELSIRTYKVVPLSQRCGLVDWCEGTMPIGEYLLGKNRNNGAHARYRPNDKSSHDCRSLLSKAEKGAGRSSKLKIYKEITKSFHPVFRHFFLEKFADPSTWFARRLAYTRSCATSSIVGYVVGLGDRHVHNILIDCNSAEFVHIDLGVAFEQGKLLPTPETVPFRLTRDIVDGMGLAGVEGVFRKCCEKTMKVMRQSHETVLTIVDVLLYDPLYEWTLSPLKAMGLQQRRSPEVDASEIPQCTLPLSEIQGQPNHMTKTDQSRNKMAERVLVRLKQKLDGCDEGSFISIEGQINLLIQNARDESRLCCIYPGWQPWL